MSIRSRLERLEEQPQRVRPDSLNDTAAVAKLTAIIEAHRCGDRNVPKGVLDALAIIERCKIRKEVDDELL